MEGAPSRVASTGASEANAAGMPRHAVGIDPVVPAAACAPGAPGHVVLLLAVGITRLLIAAAAGIGLRAGTARAVVAAMAATPISDSLIMVISSLVVFQSTHDRQEIEGSFPPRQSRA